MEMNYLIGVFESNPDAAYDYICNNYYKMSKEELKDVAKELLYIMHVKMSKEEHDEALGYVAEELRDFYAED